MVYTVAAKSSSTPPSKIIYLIYLFILSIFFAQIFTEDVPCHALPSTKFSDSCTTCLESEMKNGGKGGVDELLAGKSKNTAHVQMRLKFRRVKNFRKGHDQKPSHPKFGD
jgi:hypothetical protein